MSTTAEMTCEEVDVLLPLVAEGAIDAESDPVLFAHLALCQTCQDNLVAHDLVTVGIERSTVQPGPQVIRPAAASWHHRRLPLPVALAASLMAAVGLWTWLDQMHGDRQHQEPPRAQVMPVTYADGQTVYFVVQDGQVSVIDPNTLDGKSKPARQSAVPVNLPKFNQ